MPHISQMALTFQQTFSFLFRLETSCRVSQPTLQVIFNDGFNQALARAIWYAVPYEIIIVHQSVRTSLAAEAFDMPLEEQLIESENEGKASSSMQPILNHPCGDDCIPLLKLGIFMTLCVVFGLIVGGGIGFLIGWFGPGNNLVECPMESTGFLGNESESSSKGSVRDRSSQGSIAALSQVTGASTTQSYVAATDDQRRTTQAKRRSPGGYQSICTTFGPSAPSDRCLILRTNPNIAECGQRELRYACDGQSALQIRPWLTKRNIADVMLNVDLLGDPTLPLQDDVEPLHNAYSNAEVRGERSARE
uniref:SRCR domain-containing protein n=1 Tax=Ascaris lumbricoides TaxID=6252 RepID=A0A0M3HET5_ASCLU